MIGSSVANYHAEGYTTKQENMSGESSCWAGLCSSHNPTLQLCSGRVLARSCICTPPVQQTLGSQVDHGQYEDMGLLPTCALALLDSCCTAKIYACCSSACVAGFIAHVVPNLSYRCRQASTTFKTFHSDCSIKPKGQLKLLIENPCDSWMQSGRLCYAAWCCLTCQQQ